jgi:predicted ATPase
MPPPAPPRDTAPVPPPRIESLRVENYRALHRLNLRGLTPLTVLLGPNGSGKSTLFDVFNFLSECFRFTLRHAWDRRGRARELRTRGAEEPILIELGYRERPQTPLITYHLKIAEENGAPVIEEEWLRWKRGSHGQPFRFVDYRRGQGRAVKGDAPDEYAERSEIPLRAPDLLAVNQLGGLAEHPRVAALREFITDWYVSYLSIEDTRRQPEAGPQERLSKTGDNLANVIQYLKERFPDRLDRIFRRLSTRVPRLERVLAEPMPDGRLLLQIKDAPFDQPVLSRFASDGTLKMLAYLVLLHDPEPPRFIGIEEPENFLHPRLLLPLGEECRAASARAQLLVTTHSPFFLDAMRPEEVRVLFRDQRGYTQVRRVSDIRGIPEFLNAGATLGQLWTEGRFGTGDPFGGADAPADGPDA